MLTLPAGCPGFNEEYEYHRVLAFVQRPNIYLRARLRNSLQDLTVMKKSHHNTNAAHKKAAAAAAAAAGAGLVTAAVGSSSGSGSGVRRGAAGGWPGWAGLGSGPPATAASPPPRASASSTASTTTEQTPPPPPQKKDHGASPRARGKPPPAVDFTGQPLPGLAGKTTREGDGGASVAGDGSSGRGGGGNSAIGGGSVPLYGACVGLHVRNGDAATGELSCYPLMTAH